MFISLNELGSLVLEIDGARLDASFLDTTTGAPDHFTMLKNSACPADLDDSGLVDFDDILVVLAAWGNEGGPDNLDESGVVDFTDLLIALATWGPCE